MDDAHGTLDIDMACHGPANPAITPIHLKGSFTS